MMKKLLYFIPAVCLLLFYVFCLAAHGASVEPLGFSCLVLFAVSGVLLSCGRKWGAVFGILPGIYIVYTGIFKSGQIINVIPIGLIIILFYALTAVLSGRGK